MKVTVNRPVLQIAAYDNHPPFPFLATYPSTHPHSSREVFIVYGVSSDRRWQILAYFANNSDACQVGESVSIAGVPLELWNGSLTLSNG